jgi:NADPH-dependent 2,4-dienoyl-CoA reductase/sulfur reductase-like enzyme
MVMRQHEHTNYPVNDMSVTFTDRGGEMKTVIVGGVAAGASTGARLRRLDESAEIVVLERDHYVSFANCGLPYHIGGTIPDRDSLLLQTPESLGRALALEVRTGQEVSPSR